MDFAPMNMRMAVPHANDVGEIQHNLNQQAALQQDFKAEQHKKLIERQQNQVRTKDEAEERKLRIIQTESRAVDSRLEAVANLPRRLWRSRKPWKLQRNRLWLWTNIEDAV